MTYVFFESWAGHSGFRVTILKECPKRSLVRFEEPAFFRPAGYVQYVPNWAIKQDPSDGDVGKS